MLALNANRYISGHGDLFGKEALGKRLSDIEVERARFKELIGQGQSLEQIEAAIHDPNPTEAAGGTHRAFTPYSAVAYREFTKKTP